MTTKTMKKVQNSPLSPVLKPNINLIPQPNAWISKKTNKFKIQITTGLNFPTFSNKKIQQFKKYQTSLSRKAL